MDHLPGTPHKLWLVQGVNDWSFRINTLARLIVTIKSGSLRKEL